MMDVDERLRKSAQAVRTRLAQEPALELRASPRTHRRPLYAIAAVIVVLLGVAGVLVFRNDDGGRRVATGEPSTTTAAIVNADSYGDPADVCTAKNQNPPLPGRAPLGDLTGGVTVKGPAGNGLCVGLLQSSKYTQYMGLATDGIVSGSDRVGVCTVRNAARNGGGLSFGSSGQGTIDSVLGSTGPDVKVVILTTDSGTRITAATFEVPAFPGVRWYALRNVAGTRVILSQQLDAAGHEVKAATDTTTCPGIGRPTTAPDTKYSVTVEGADLPQFPDRGPDPAIGKQVPTVSGVNGSGASSTTKSDGKATVIGVFTTFDPRGDQEVKDLVALRQSGAWPADVNLAALITASDVATDDDAPAQWLTRRGWDAPFVMDDVQTESGAGSGKRAFGPNGYPLLIWVDASGKVVQRTEGAIDTAQLQSMLTQLSQGQSPVNPTTTTAAGPH
ncbi:MAG: TlpA family protein disulfide reductase [Actinomycetia bacterium]|nr:TlpA family protein disulfide reductase [Actinomycetes bacterium]